MPHPGQSVGCSDASLWPNPGTGNGEKRNGLRGTRDELGKLGAQSAELLGVSGVCGRNRNHTFGLDCDNTAAGGPVTSSLGVGD